MDGQLLRDAAVRPTKEILAEALGKSYPAYAEFVIMIARFGVDAEWRFYNDGKAWLKKGIYKRKTARGADKEKTVFWLGVWDGFFKVSFYFGEKSREVLSGLPVSAGVKQMIAEAKNIGKLKFFPLSFEVRSDELFGDLRALIEFQKNLG